MSKAKRIVRAIIGDLKDRGGLSDEWDAIDQDIKTEIIKEWEGIVEKELSDDELSKALKRLLDLDKGGYLHRDKLDTEETFEMAREVLKKCRS